MTATGGQQGDIAGFDGEHLTGLAAEADFGVAGRDTEDFVRGAVVVREGVDAIAPTAAGPAVLGEEAFEECGGIRGISG